MNRYLVLCLFLFTAVSLFAGDGFDNMFIGAGPEVNANTREGAAFGGSLSFGADFYKQFSAGLKIIFSHNIGNIFTVEPLAFFRYYLPLPIKGFFLQADIGAAVFIEESKAYPAVSAGAAAGWRFKITEMFCMEPYIRGGYPFIWGVGVNAVILLPRLKRVREGDNEQESKDD